MTPKVRTQVLEKFNAHCAYCGKEITIKTMQVDHLVAKRRFEGQDNADADNISNLFPACGRCNHYKRAGTLEYFRIMLLGMRHKVLGTYLGKVAEDYGMVEWKGWDGEFYFERQGDSNGNT